MPTEGVACLKNCPMEPMGAPRPHWVDDVRSERGCRDNEEFLLFLAWSALPCPRMGDGDGISSWPFTNDMASWHRVVILDRI